MPLSTDGVPLLSTGALPYRSRKSCEVGSLDEVILYLQKHQDLSLCASIPHDLT